MDVLFWFVVLVASFAIGVVVYLVVNAKMDTVTVSQALTGDIRFTVKSGKSFIFRVARFKKNEPEGEDLTILNTIGTVYDSDTADGVWIHYAALPPDRDYFAFVVFDGGEIIGRRFRLEGPKLEV